MPLTARTSFADHCRMRNVLAELQPKVFVAFWNNARRQEGRRDAVDPAIESIDELPWKISLSHILDCLGFVASHREEVVISGDAFPVPCHDSSAAVHGDSKGGKAYSRLPPIGRRHTSAGVLLQGSERCDVTVT
jgi:hypothetical protein